MAGTIAEAFGSRTFSLGREAARELIFVIVGAADEDEAKSLLVANAPAVYEGLVIESIEAEPQNNSGLWRGRAKYQRLSGTDEYTFNTGGGTAKITQALSQTGYASSGTPPDFKGAIGVTKDGVEGVDITVPQYEFSETHYFSDAAVTQAYKLALFNLTGRVNLATFRGFDAGECLFLGANGSKRGDEQWAITFNFACSPNLTGVSVGDITGIDKDGWDYLWVRYEDFEDTLAIELVSRPSSAHVAKVYQDGDFDNLGI